VNVAVAARKKKRRKKQSLQRSKRKRKIKMADTRYCNREIYRVASVRVQRVQKDRVYSERPENLEFSVACDPLGLEPMEVIIPAQLKKGKSK
jgi:hypothetical protein